MFDGYTNKYYSFNTTVWKALNELPIPINTKIKIQWIPGNKVLWCPKGLDVITSLSGFQQHIDGREWHSFLQFGSHGSHVKIG